VSTIKKNPDIVFPEKKHLSPAKPFRIISLPRENYPFALTAKTAVHNLYPDISRQPVTIGIFFTEDPNVCKQRTEYGRDEGGTREG